MYRDLEHPDITSALRTGYPRGQEDEVLNDEYEDRLYEERMESGLLDEE